MAETETALEPVIWDTYLYDTVLMVRSDEDGGAAVKIPAHRLKLSFFEFFKTMFESSVGQATIVLQDNHTLIDLTGSLGTKESWLCVLQWVYSENTFIDVKRLKIAKNVLQRFCEKWFQWHTLDKKEEKEEKEEEEAREEQELANCEKLLHATQLLGFLTSLDLDFCNLVGVELKYSKAAQWACMLAFIHTKDPRQAETQLQFSRQEFSATVWRRSFDTMYSKFEKCDDDAERKSALWEDRYDSEAWWKVFTDEGQQVLGWLAILVFCAPTTYTLFWETVCDKLQQPLSIRTAEKPNVLYMPRLYGFSSCLKLAIPCPDHLAAHVSKRAFGEVLRGKMLIAREGGHFVSHVGVAQDATFRIPLFKQSIWHEAFDWLNLPVVSQWEVNGGRLVASSTCRSDCWSVAPRSWEIGKCGSLLIFCTSCRFLNPKLGLEAKAPQVEQVDFVPPGTMFQSFTDVRDAFEVMVQARKPPRSHKYV